MATTTTYDTKTTNTNTTTREIESRKKTGLWIVGALVVLALIAFFSMRDRTQVVNESNPAVYSQPGTGVGNSATSSDVNGATVNPDAKTGTDAAMSPKAPDTVDTN